MRIRRRVDLGIAVFLLTCHFGAWWGAARAGNLTGRERSQTGARNPSAKRVIVVADVINATRIGEIGDAADPDGTHHVALFSPDGTWFALVLKRGNISRNTTDYSLLLFQSVGICDRSTPVVLARFSSSSNRPAIQKVKWLNNRTISFLGENPGEEQQLYTVDCYTRKVDRLTFNRTSLASYAIGGSKRRIVFTAYQPADKLMNEKSERRGITVSNQLLSDLVSRQDYTRSKLFLSLFTQRPGLNRATPLKVSGNIFLSGLWLSPNGRFVIAQISPITISQSWSGYNSDDIQRETRGNHASGAPRFIYEYALIDTETGDSKSLVKAPMDDERASVVWAPDSNSVIVSGTYLPLDISDPIERKVRESTTFVAQVTLPTLEVVPITARDLRLVGWNKVNPSVLDMRTEHDPTTANGGFVSYKMTSGQWKEEESSTRDSGGSRQVRITIKEDMNTPPRVYATNCENGPDRLLLDLNTQFNKLAFAHVEEVTFRATDGHQVKAGLYHPVGYEPGRRYPLVIQTHGWDPGKFWIDGPHTTAFAAQPLAGKGFFVLQLEQYKASESTPAEVKGEVSAYEGAIDFLDHQGLIDRKGVGIIGFSRTGLEVEYALVHSEYHIAAATLCDISDSGYFRYLAMLNFVSSYSLDSEGLAGALPFGAGLSSWIKESPGFNLHRVTTPVWMEVNQPIELFFEWEWFTGLTRLRKPVELIYIPEGAHELVKPSDRLVSLQGNVDWFCFWIKGEMDPDTQKVDQYARWRKLRLLREVGNAPSVEQH